MARIPSLFFLTDHKFSFILIFSQDATFPFMKGNFSPSMRHLVWKRENLLEKVIWIVTTIGVLRSVSYRELKIKEGCGCYIEQNLIFLAELRKLLWIFMVLINHAWTKCEPFHYLKSSRSKMALGRHEKGWMLYG